MRGKFHSGREKKKKEKGETVTLSVWSVERAWVANGNHERPSPHPFPSSTYEVFNANCALARPRFKDHSLTTAKAPFMTMLSLPLSWRHLCHHCNHRPSEQSELSNLRHSLAEINDQVSENILMLPWLLCKYTMQIHSRLILVLEFLLFTCNPISQLPVT